MKNFILVSRKKFRGEDGKKYTVRIYKHTPTNRLIKEVVSKDSHVWQDVNGNSTASLEFWIQEFFKHPKTLS